MTAAFDAASADTDHSARYVVQRGGDHEWLGLFRPFGSRKRVGPGRSLPAATVTGFAAFAPCGLNAEHAPETEIARCPAARLSRCPANA